MDVTTGSRCGIRILRLVRLCLLALILEGLLLKGLLLNGLLLKGLLLNGILEHVRQAAVSGKMLVEKIVDDLRRELNGYAVGCDMGIHSGTDTRERTLR